MQRLHEGQEGISRRIKWREVKHIFSKTTKFNISFWHKPNSAGLRVLVNLPQNQPQIYQVMSEGVYCKLSGVYLPALVDDLPSHSQSLV